jgi:hypothetical protein
MNILRDFEVPMVVLGPHERPDTRHIVHCSDQLQALADRYNPVVVQRHVRLQQRIAVVCLGFECIAALVSDPGGGPFDVLPSVPPTDGYLATPLRLSRQLLERTQLDDIQAQWALDGDRWLLLAIQRPPASWHTGRSRIGHHGLIGRMIEAGKL